MLLADYAEYIKAQERVDELYKVNKRTTNTSIYSLFFYLEST
jgi:hypothetical protein